MATKSVDKTKVFSFRLATDELDRLTDIARGYDRTPQDFVRDLVKFILGDTVKEGDKFAREVGQVLARKQEEFNIFSQLIADTTAKFSEVGQVKFDAKKRSK